MATTTTPEPPLKFWCHECQKEVAITGTPDTETLECAECKNCFVEELVDLLYHHDPENNLHPALYPSERGVQRVSSDNGSASSPDTDNSNGVLSTHVRFGNGSLTQSLANSISGLVQNMLTGLNTDTRNSLGLTSSSPVTVVVHNDTTLLQGQGANGVGGEFSDYYFGGMDQLLNSLMLAGGSNGPPPASEKSIKDLKTVKIAPEHVAQGIDCAVCKDVLEEGFECTELPCSHLFCPDCILPWLKKHNTCPVCRHELPTAQGAEMTKLERLGSAVARTERQGPI